MVEFKVSGMGCGSCAAKISAAIRKLDASAQVVVDLPAGRVRVASSASAEAVARVIHDLGYPAEPV